MLLHRSMVCALLGRNTTAATPAGNRVTRVLSRLKPLIGEQGTGQDCAEGTLTPEFASALYKSRFGPPPREQVTGRRSEVLLNLTAVNALGGGSLPNLVERCTCPSVLSH